MAIITIERNIGLDDIDSYYRLLERYHEIEGRVEILIPRSLDNDYMGLVVSLIQFVITWIRYPYAGRLLLDVANPDAQDWDQLFEKEHMYPIVALTMSKTGIYDATGQISLIRYIKPSLDKMHEWMVKVKPLKGWKLLLTSVDHFPASQGLLPCFEEPSGYIDNESTVGRNLKPAIESLLNYSIDVRSEYKASDNDFVAIIHELMKNTYEWGKTDRQNVPVDPSVRGVFLKFFRRKRSKAIREFMFHRGLNDYFSNQRLRENNIEELYFLEISVFDSGVGFVDKYNEKGLQDLSDIDIIKRCLIKHRTSAKGLEKDEKGIGLDRILHLLDNRGFLRIKTNRSCVYRNLISHPYRISKDEKDMHLFDWNTHSPSDFPPSVKSEGSIVTIIYPLAINELA